MSEWQDPEFPPGMDEDYRRKLLGLDPERIRPLLEGNWTETDDEG